MKDLSVIIPYCKEYPQLWFTIQDIIEELDGLDFEIIAVNNKSDEMIFSGKRSVWDHVNANPYVKCGTLKNVKYDVKLSHWQAKNKGIEVSSGRRLLFLDAHCIVKKNSIRNMLESDLRGSLHMQICYMLDPRPLIYKIQEQEMGYRFTRADTSLTYPYEVPVMSTCGMMIERKTIDDIGHWNSELGIYGGGENYMMYKLATCGFPIMIHPKATVFHFADARGYGGYILDDYIRNQFIAAYCIGGEPWLTKLRDARKAAPGHRPEVVEKIAEDVRSNEVVKRDREFISKRQVITVDDYFKKWTIKKAMPVIGI